MTLLETYKQKVAPELKAKFGYKHDLAVPKMLKVTVNVGVGRMTKDRPFIDMVAEGVTAMTGQKAMLVKAKKSISAFKIRQGDIVGVTTVLRGQRLYDFVEKLIKITLPRVRDFRGLSEKIVDAGGNMSIGFKEQSAFAEIKMDQIDRVHGLEVVITTNAKNHEAGLAMFKLMGFPFKKES
jgi:large subunit ribosomal protein L5